MKKWNTLSTKTKRLILSGFVCIPILASLLILSFYFPLSISLQKPPYREGNPFSHPPHFAMTSWYTDNDDENYYQLEFYYPANLTINSSHHPYLDHSGYYINIWTKSSAPNVLGFVKSVRMTLFCSCLYQRELFLYGNNSWNFVQNDSCWAAAPTDFFTSSFYDINYSENVLIFDPGHLITHDSVTWSQIGKVVFSAYRTFEGWSRIWFCTNSTVASHYYRGVYSINQTTQTIISIVQVKFLMEVIWATHYGIWGSSMEYNQSYVFGDGDIGDWSYLFLVP